MNRSTVALLLLILLAFMPRLAEAGDNPWKSTPGKETFPGAHTVIVKDEISYTVSRDGGHVLGEHEVIKALDEEGMKELSSATRSYLAGGQEIFVDEARVIQPDGAVEPVAAKDIADSVPLMVKGHPLYGKLHLKTIHFRNLRPGAIVEYRLRTVSRVPYFERQFWGLSFTREFNPMLESSFTVTAPAGLPLELLPVGHKGLKPAITRKDGNIVYFWSVKNRPALTREEGMPSLRVVASRIMISTFRSWREMVGWFNRQWRLGEKERRELKKLAAGLFTAKDTPAQKIEKIHAFMAQKETVPLELPPERWLHHPVHTLYDQKSLDEMDKAALFNALLDIGGIEASPALVASHDHGRINRDIVFPEDFNQVMLVVADRGGERWIDPCDRTESSSTYPATLQGADALLVREGRHEFTTVPTLPYFSNREEYNFNGSVSGDGTLEGVVTLDEFGGYASQWRAFVQDIEPGEEGQLFTLMLNQISPSAELLDYYLPTERDKEFKLTFSFSAPKYGEIMGSHIRLKAPLFAMKSLADYARVPADAKKHPIFLGGVFQEDQRIRLTLPEGWALKFHPKDTSLDSPFCSYQLQCRKEKGELLYYSRIAVKQSVIPLESYGRFKETVDAIRKVEKSFIVLQKEVK